MRPQKINCDWFRAAASVIWKSKEFCIPNQLCSLHRAFLLNPGSSFFSICVISFTWKLWIIKAIETQAHHEFRMRSIHQTKNIGWVWKHFSIFRAYFCKFFLVVFPPTLVNFFSETLSLERKSLSLGKKNNWIFTLTFSHKEESACLWLSFWLKFCAWVLVFSTAGVKRKSLS